MTNGSVLYHRHDGIVTLTLNRPETLNAMNEAMIGQIERILIELEAATAVRVVVLPDAGRAFSSGGDQKRARAGEGQQALFDGDPGGALIDLDRSELAILESHPNLSGPDRRDRGM